MIKIGKELINPAHIVRVYGNGITVICELSRIVHRQHNGNNHDINSNSYYTHDTLTLNPQDENLSTPEELIELIFKRCKGVE